MSKKLLTVVLAVVMIAATLIPAFSAFADETPGVQTPVADASEWNNIDADGWYVAPDGGFKFNVGSWIMYDGGKGQIKIAEGATIPCSCACIMAYGPDSGSVDSEEVFENKTAANFKAVLQEDLTVFEKTTVGNGNYTMYYARSSSYENYVFQHNNTKYFINFIYGYTTDRDAFAEFAANIMSTIVIADDPVDEPEPEPTTPDISVIAASDATAKAGEQVEVEISIVNNPGVASVALTVGYDSDVLTLVGVNDGGILGSAVHSDDFSANPYTLSWANDTATENFTEDGVIATLVFVVAADAEDQDVDVTLYYSVEDYEIMDVDMEPVEIDLEDGVVTIESETTEPDPTPVDPDPTPVDPDPTPVDPDPTPVDPNPTPVDTGDNYMIYVAAVLAVLSLAVIVLCKKSAKAR